MQQRALDYPLVVVGIALMVVTLLGVPLAAVFLGFTWVDWTMFAVLYVASGLGITVGYHRLYAHRSFQCSEPVKAALLVAGAWALENSALRWCSDHVRHHAHCDTDRDPYNAKEGFWHSHCGWIFREDPHRDELYEVQFKKDRMVVWQHRYYAALVLSGLALPFAVGFLHRGWAGGLSCLALAGFGRLFLVLNATFCINSVCHLWGKQPLGTRNTSRDSWFVSLVTFGEGYHNYHHNRARDYRNGPKWYNFDPSKWFIFGLSKIGLARNLYRYD
jgi:stearoyl-CoA desaturase (Delta-9 desaturase)